MIPMKKLFFLLSVFCCVAWAATSYDQAKPMRIGPVSVYGALGTNGNKIVSLSSGQEVMLRGMSLFWGDAIGVPYYNEIAISWAADYLGIDVFRYAMPAQYYNSDGLASEPVAASYAYISSPTSAMTRLDRMVAAAIENDIYIIIDWHSHRAEQEQSSALGFFRQAAERYKGIPNIIWEVYNEPVHTDMGTVARYANTVIAAIRVNSPNLALVGTPNWSQMGSCGGVSQTNVAYVFHFYAASHSVGSYSGNINSCRNGGNAVFISEWGTTSANGSGAVSTSEASSWTSYMETNKISNCNWSLRHSTVDGKEEKSAMFSGSNVLASRADFEGASYTQSGTFVKNYLTSHKTDWNNVITSGARSGSCAFSHVTMSIADGQLSGKANSGCSYTSSNSDVAVIENGVIKAKSAGVAIMTGNDNTKTVVQVTPLPAQTLRLTGTICRLDGECSGGPFASLSGGSSRNEYKLAAAKTNEGASVTMTSDNSSAISVKKAKCTNDMLCYKDLNTEIWMIELNELGTANIHVTAPAVTGYAAIDTTVVVEYRKLMQKMNSTKFYNRTVELGSVTDMLASQALGGAKVTYTLSDPSLASIDGTNLVAGNKDGVLIISAEVEECSQYEPLSTSIAVIIGAGDPSIMAIEPIKVGQVSNGVEMYHGKILLNVPIPGLYNVQVLDMKGRIVYSKVQDYGSVGQYELSLEGLSRGQYIVKVRSNTHYSFTRWDNR